jgi:hypothetical protein
MNLLRLKTPAKHQTIMLYLSTVALLGCIAVCQSPSPAVATSSALAKPTTSLPKVPPGKTTVMGGEIRNVDPVRDQFTLKVFGGHPVKILFDERTTVFKNGKQIPILDLRPDDHASVQTASDGSSIFAVRINMLSNLPENDFHGRVAAYNDKSHALTVITNPGNQSLTFNVPPGTPISNISQDGSSTPEQGSVNFVSGSLVNVEVMGGHGKNGVAARVDILAVPGATFVFAGKLSALDVHAGKLSVLDPRDGQSYPIKFGPSLVPAAKQLHQGASVKVSTTFDGKQYVANQITTE